VEECYELYDILRGALCHAKVYVLPKHLDEKVRPVPVIHLDLLFENCPLLPCNFDTPKHLKEKRFTFGLCSGVLLSLGSDSVA
jgi:hypothetical protein